MNKLKETAFSLQTNKSPGHDETSFYVIKTCFGSLSKRLLHIFRLSLQEGIFQDDLKTAKITPIFKAGDENHFLVTIDQSLFYHVFPKYLRKSCIKDFPIIYQSTTSFIITSLVSSKVTQQNML